MKVLIVDDELKILEVLKAYLEKEGYEVITTTNGGEALELFYIESPDIMLIDLMLPKLSGEDLCRAIRKKSRVPIIMITAKTEEDDEINGLEIGADDYITKPFSTKQVVARVKALLRRSYEEEKSIITFNNNNLKIDLDKKIVSINNKEISLTATEFNLLEVFVKSPKRIFTRDDLIIKVLGYENDSLDRVIDSHIKNLRQKIEMDSKKPQFIITVYGMGYRFEGKKD